MSSSSSLGKFLLGTLVGGAVGAVIGMLLAPRSGSETRALIKDEFDNRYRQSSDAVREKAEQIKEKATGLKDRIAEISGELEETGRKTVNRITEAVKNATDSPTT